MRTHETELPYAVRTTGVEDEDERPSALEVSCRAERERSKGKERVMEMRYACQRTAPERCGEEGGKAGGGAEREG